MLISGTVSCPETQRMGMGDILRIARSFPSFLVLIVRDIGSRKLFLPGK